MDKLERVQKVARPLEEVFSFFADPVNLEELTPHFLQFKILTPQPVEMKAGALIDYQLRLFGIPFRWQTEIVEYKPGKRFRDVQVRGPYHTWNHLHEFSEIPGGTLIVDRIEYKVRFGIFGSIARELFVRRDLDRIFQYRQEKIAERFGGIRETETGDG